MNSQITRQGLERDRIHLNPPKCIPDDVQGETWNDVVRCSVRIEDVTCPMCIYYYMNPKARGEA